MRFSHCRKQEVSWCKICRDCDDKIGLTIILCFQWRQFYTYKPHTTAAVFTGTILNSLAPGIFQSIFSEKIFQQILVIDGWSISCEIVLKWMPMDLTDGKSTLVQVMAWCRQATSHYLSQYWPRSLSPYGVIRPQWVAWNIFSIQMSLRLISKLSSRWQ